MQAHVEPIGSATRAGTWRELLALELERGVRHSQEGHRGDGRGDDLGKHGERASVTKTP